MAQTPALPAKSRTTVCQPVAYQYDAERSPAVSGSELWSDRSIQAGQNDVEWVGARAAVPGSSPEINYFGVAGRRGCLTKVASEVLDRRVSQRAAASWLAMKVLGNPRAGRAGGRSGDDGVASPGIGDRGLVDRECSALIGAQQGSPDHDGLGAGVHDRSNRRRCR
jgi:hypothetical protein